MLKGDFLYNLKHMKTRKGFTLVELIIVITVIAILATIVSVGLNRYRTDANDAVTASHVTVITEALEKYYDQHGEYPGCNALTNNPSNVASSVLKGIDEAALTVPTAPAGTTNSIKCNQTLQTSGENFIQYIGDNSVDCNTSGNCLSFTIRYRVDGNNEIVTVKSRRAAVIATSGVPVLTAQSTGFTSANTSWTPTPNATGYTIERATNKDFTTGYVTRNVAATTTSEPYTGLTTGTTYYFRVKATQAADQTSWSKTAQAKTDQLDAPALATTATSSTEINSSWSSVSLATGYTVQQSKSASFTSPVAFNTSSRAQAYTGLTQGGEYYYRVRATAGSIIGPWSDSVQGSTPVDTPSAPVMNAITTNDTGTYDESTFSWTAGSTCPTGTQMQYQNRYRRESSQYAWTSASTATSRMYPTYDGYYYITEVQARCRNTTSSIASNWSGTASRDMIEDVRQPTSIGWDFTRQSATSILISSRGTCRVGTSFFGNMNPYLGSPWVWSDPSAPRYNQSGWYIDPGDAVVDSYGPAFIINSTTGNFPSGLQFGGRGVFTCYNSSTGRMNPGRGGWIFSQQFYNW